MGVGGRVQMDVKAGSVGAIWVWWVKKEKKETQKKKKKRPCCSWKLGIGILLCLRVMT